MTTQRLAKMAIIAAIYVALTLIFAPISYGNIQFRISEVLVLFVFYKKDYIVPLVIGTAIANIFSPLGPIDLLFGTMGTFLAVLGIYIVSKFKSKFKHQWIALLIASLMPVIANGLLVAWELNIVFTLPYWETALWVAIGEAVVVSLGGVIIFSLLEKNQPFMDLLTSDDFKNHKKAH